MLWKNLPSRSKSQLQDAIANLQKSADQGLTSGQCQLGNIYFMGHFDGGEPDYAKAHELYEKAAATGDPMANFRLGVMHDNGLGGLKQSYRKARRMYEKAATKVRSRSLLSRTRSPGQ